ncbi:hypothetical protein ILUMI_20947 [Ignelater luminosus]|uniref:Rho-GAP domain-containing protein n=1 Tax=Ignelater luminosus TaxID=2038154 RepID=A0A8K0CIR3_IGNLU|nr:hypothetical protein ILUMI_20947 [Ignelater luminosus]
MFMNDVNKKEEIRNVAIQDLRNLGIKFRPKKQRHHVQEVRIGRRIFKTALHLLPMQTVTLASGQQLVVPKLVHELCSFILTKVETEGLFRKGGSKARQNEIRLSLDAGCCLGNEHHEVDVANVLKTFFRELPEPLFPFNFHEPFLRCTLLKENKLHALFLTCLLLPSEHLNTLAYFMQFLHHVTQFSNVNKMDSYNLSVIIGPTIFPVDEKLANNTTHRITKTCELFKLLIENACNIGVIPEDIIDRIASLSSSTNSHSDDEVANTKRKKKRRSGSLTRMFNGLRKIVSSKSVDTVTSPVLVTPDLLITPNLTKSAKKRKLEGGGFSNKKKRELLQTLPQGTTLSTPISVNPNPKKISPPNSTSKTNHYIAKEKKSQWNLGSKRNKHSKQSDDAASTNSNAFAGTRAVLERRWSAVSQAAGFRRNKTRNSCGTVPLQHKKSKTELQKPENLENKVPDNCDIVLEEKHIPELDYVKISRTEYEEIKNRVSAIEQRISLELDNISHENNAEQQSSSDNDDVIVKVQTAYEKTLVEAEPLSPTTDQLARRLSKELKIRRSYEQKVVRSPSARKIGSLRRRSRELERQNAKVQRNQSWHVDHIGAIPRINLKRGRPNTVLTGLRHPTPLKASDGSEDSSLDSQLIKTPARAASFHGSATPTPTQNFHRSVSTGCNTSKKCNSLNSEKWTSAEGYFNQSKMTDSLNSLNNGRASLARLRSQNAGMVLAKARLFDGLIDSDNSTNSENSSMFLSKTKVENKIGTTRSVEKVSNRIRSLKYDDKRLGRQSNSPKKRYLRSPRQNYNMIVSTPLQPSLDEKENQIQADNFSNVDFLGSAEKVQVAALKDCNRIDISDHRLKTVSPGYVTPKGMPQLKRSLTVRSPKRPYKTPLRNENKQTPLKILTASKVY